MDTTTENQPLRRTEITTELYHEADKSLRSLVVSEMIRRLPQKVYLQITDYRDVLSQDQVKLLLKQDIDTLAEEIEELLFEVAQDSISQEIGNIDECELMADDLDKADLELLSAALHERDVSDGLGDITRTTRPVLVRIPLHPESLTIENEQQGITAITAALTQWGWGPTTENAQELLDGISRPGNYELEAVVRISPQQVLQAWRSSQGRGLLTVSLAGPTQVVLRDAINGAGWETTVTGPSAPHVLYGLELDSYPGDKPVPMGWDDIAGVVHSAYANEVTFNPITEAPQQTQIRLGVHIGFGATGTFQVTSQDDLARRLETLGVTVLDEPAELTNDRNSVVMKRIGQHHVRLLSSNGLEWPYVDEHPLANGNFLEEIIEYMVPGQEVEVVEARAAEDLSTVYWNLYTLRSNKVQLVATHSTNL